MYWKKEFPKWVEQLSRELNGNIKSEATLTLVGQEKPILLHSQLSKQIWGSEKHAPQPSTLPGNHPVYKLKLPSGQFVYCKLFPGLPGINDALQYLYRRFFDAQRGLPWSISGLLRIDNQSIPILISKDAGSRINDSRLSLLEPNNNNKLTLFSMITNTEDGKKENYALVKNSRGFYEISNVDYEHSLVSDLKEEEYWFSSGEKLFVKVFLFCLGSMQHSLDDEAIDELLCLDVIETAKAWLAELKPIADSYEVVFKDYTFSSDANPNQKSYVHFVLPAAAVLQIVYKIQLLQTMLKKNRNTSLLKLLHALEPKIAPFYEGVLSQSGSAIERFDNLVSKYKLYGWSTITNSYSTTLTAAQEIFDFLTADNHPKIVTPKVALEMLEQYEHSSLSLNRKYLQSMQGEIAHFKQLPIKEREAVLKLTLFNQMEARKRELFLGAICNSIDFKKNLFSLSTDLINRSVLK